MPGAVGTSAWLLDTQSPRLHRDRRPRRRLPAGRRSGRVEGRSVSDLNRRVAVSAPASTSRLRSPTPARATRSPPSPDGCTEEGRGGQAARQGRRVLVPFAYATAKNGEVVQLAKGDLVVATGSSRARSVARPPPRRSASSASRTEREGGDVMAVTPAAGGRRDRRPHPFVDAQTAQWQTWIDQAYYLIERRYGADYTTPVDGRR
jgi:hypothetical protein